MGKDQDLLHAVRNHDRDTLLRMLSKNKSSPKGKLIGTTRRLNVNYQDSDGMTGLHQAALMGDLDMMKMLIDNGAMVDIKDMKGMRPLHYAAWQGKELGAVQLLLKEGSSANEAAHDGMTPLHLACEHGHFNVVSQLLQHHGDPTAENITYSKTPLDLACEFGRYRVVELLIQSNLCNELLLGNPPEDMADNNRSTCLHLAAKNGHNDVMRLLLHAGVDINRQTLKGTCLHEAALCGKIEVVRLLLDCGIDVNKTNSYDQTALDIVNKFTGTKAGKELKQLLKEASYVVQGRVMKDYMPSMHEPNHLTLKEGDVLTVLEQHPSGMWKGYVSRPDGQITKTGYFPASAVVLVDNQATQGQHESHVNSGSLGRVIAQDYSELCTKSELPPTVPGSAGDTTSYGTVGADNSFPPPPSILLSPTHYSSRDSDRDSGISPQQSYPSQPFPQSSFPGRQPSPNSPAERTAEWLGRYVDSDHRSGSPNRDSPGSSNRNSTASSSGSGGYLPPNYVTTNGQATQQHRLSGQSYESGVSGVSVTSRQSYHSNSSSSLGSLDRLEESGYSSTVNVHELFQSGIADEEILRTWLADLHHEEYYNLFLQAGYDMPTIAHMTPQDLSAIGISNPKHRKRIKQDINKLQLDDGFPDYKPTDIGQWLHLLGLQEYYECLQQECQTIEGVLDIECEDLEEIGITKLGHQKKLQVAIERLKRIQSGHKRLSNLDRRSTPEALEPPAYQASKWLGVDSSNYWGDRSMRKSSSGENLYAASGPLELTTFQQPKDEETQRSSAGFRGEAMGNSWPSPNPKSTQHQQDLVAIQVHRAAMAMPHQTESRIEGEPPPPYTFYDTREHEHVDGDATPTNERRRIPATEDTDGMAMIRRPSAKVSPRIAPKPKPVAKIIAKTKRSSREGMPEIIKLENHGNTMENSSGSMAYSCSTLPRKFSKRNHKEHIYDEPADNPESPTHATFGVNNHSLPNSPAHQGQEIPWNKCGRKAPPPPPKRTNSIKCNMNKVGQSLELSVEDNDSQCRSASPLTCQGSPQIHGKQPHSNVIQSLSERFQSKQNVDSSVTSDRCQSPKLTNSLPPPPPQISSHVSMLASSSPGMQSTAPSSQASSYQSSQYNYVPSDSDNPLNDIIQQLEQTSGSQQAKTVTSHATHRPPPAVAPKPSLKPGTLRKDMKLGDWQDDRNDSSDDSDNSVKEKTSSVPQETVPVPAGTSDTNTLPFANENVGTIKQRNPSNKTSIVTVCGSEDGGTDDPSKNLDLNASIFDDGTDTIKRNPKCKDEPKKVAPPVAPKRKDLSSSTGNAAQQNDPGDVLNDIDNMLQDLTNELDAMLELEIS